MSSYKSGDAFLRILTYHRVADLEAIQGNPALISATPALFARQMRHLAAAWNVVTMEQVLNWISRGAAFPPRAVLVTFDDGYRDFAESAWPILKQFRLPATLFVPTSYPCQPKRRFWWDRLYEAVIAGGIPALPNAAVDGVVATPRAHSFKELTGQLKSMAHDKAMSLVDQTCEAQGVSEMAAQPVVLDWDELRKLAREGLTVGSHSRSHPILTQVLPERLEDEVRGSAEDLRLEIANCLPTFCYPGGAHDEQVVRAVTRHYVLGFTTRAGHNQLRSADPLRLMRINVTRRTTPGILRIRLHRVGAYLDRWRHRQAA